MAVSNIKVVLSCEIEVVWNRVVSLDDYVWRSDLSKIEVTEKGKQFEEYTKGGYATNFTITAFTPYERYEFDMENTNMSGHWTGVFTYGEGVTTIDFTEDVTAKRFFMKPFVGMYLKRQQAAYVADLQNALNC